MLELFTLTFTYTALILAAVAGIAAALAACAVVLVAVLGALSVTFDLATNALARRWHRKGTQPKGRIARVIYAGRRDHV